MRYYTGVDSPIPYISSSKQQLLAPANSLAIWWRSIWGNRQGNGGVENTKENRMRESKNLFFGLEGR